MASEATGADRVGGSAPADPGWRVDPVGGTDRVRADARRRPHDGASPRRSKCPRGKAGAAGPTGRSWREEVANPVERARGGAGTRRSTSGRGEPVELGWCEEAKVVASKEEPKFGMWNQRREPKEPTAGIWSSRSVHIWWIRSTFSTLAHEELVRRWRLDHQKQRRKARAACVPSRDWSWRCVPHLGCE